MWLHSQRTSKQIFTQNTNVSILLGKLRLEIRMWRRKNRRYINLRRKHQLNRRWRQVERRRQSCQRRLIRDPGHYRPGLLPAHRQPHDVRLIQHRTRRVKQVPYPCPRCLDEAHGVENKHHGLRQAALQLDRFRKAVGSSLRLQGTHGHARAPLNCTELQTW